MAAAPDLSAVDMAMVVGAVAGVFVKPIMRGAKGVSPCFTQQDCILDALNGSTIVPFAVMVGSVFSTEIFNMAMNGHKVQMAIASFIAIIILVRELIRYK